MPFYYVVSATDARRFQGGAPGSGDILQAYQRVAPPSGQWVGPAPRVTRANNETFYLTAGDLTSAAWLLELDGATDQATADAQASAVAQQVTQSLSQINGSDWGGGAVATRWSEPVNGPIAWWQSGQAALTQTTDNFPSSLAPAENAVGPTTPQSVPQGLLQQAGTNVGQGANNALLPAAGPNSPVATLTKFLEVAAFVVAGGVAIYLLWPTLSGVRRGERAVLGGSSRRSSTPASRASAAPATVPGFANPARRRHASSYVNPHDLISRAILVA